MPDSPDLPLVALLGAIVVIGLLYILLWLLVRLSVRRGPGLIRRGAELRHARQAADAIGGQLRAWPRLAAFLEARLSPRQFSGLPLTLMVAAAVYAVMLAAELLEELLEAEEMVAFDRTVNAFFDPYRASPLVPFFGWVTELGSIQCLVAVSFVMTGFLWAFRRIGWIPSLWVTVLGSSATTWAGKYILARPRPDPFQDFVAVSPSFPSAHATGSSAVYGFLAYLLMREIAGLRARFEIAFWGGLLIALVAFSRVFLSYHYLSDIATGLLVGGFWLLIGVMLAEYPRARALTRTEDQAPRPS